MVGWNLAAIERAKSAGNEGCPGMQVSLTRIWNNGRLLTEGVKLPHWGDPKFGMDKRMAPLDL